MCNSVLGSNSPPDCLKYERRQKKKNINSAHFTTYFPSRILYFRANDNNLRIISRHQAVFFFMRHTRITLVNYYPDKHLDAYGKYIKKHTHTHKHT